MLSTSSHLMALMIHLNDLIIVNNSFTINMLGESLQHEGHTLIIIKD